MFLCLTRLARVSVSKARPHPTLPVIVLALGLALATVGARPASAASSEDLRSRLVSSRCRVREIATVAIAGRPAGMEPLWDAKAPVVPYGLAPGASRENSLRAWSALAGLEFAYEDEGAVVCRREGNDAGILLADGRLAWVDAGVLGRVFRYEDLVKGRLAFLTKDFVGTLREGPGGRTVAPLPKGLLKPGREVTVLESISFQGDVWLRLEVLEGDRCGGEGGPPRVRAKGWVRGYGRNKLPAVWYFTRGC